MSLPTSLAIAEIHTAALTKNYQLLKQILSKSGEAPEAIAVVKANAYGHGTKIVVPALTRAGCRFFAVANLEEALDVRHLAPSARILVLGYTPPDAANALSKNKIEQAVFSFPYAKALDKAAKRVSAKLPVHLKLDCGMCRLGFSPDNKKELLKAVTLSHLTPTGLFTHFPTADTDKATTHSRLLQFLECRETLKNQGLSLFCHTAASAAALQFPETILDGARLGISLYGIPPVSTTLPLAPVMSLSAPIIQIHCISRGTPVGYGGEWIAPRASRIGTCPIGYADGIFRAFSGGAVSVLHKNERYNARLVGRICMDQITVDLTDTPANVGDKVILFSDPCEMAKSLGTIPYEILARIGPRVGRREV